MPRIPIFRDGVQIHDPANPALGVTSATELLFAPSAFRAPDAIPASPRYRAHRRPAVSVCRCNRAHPRVAGSVQQHQCRRGRERRPIWRGWVNS